MPDGILDCLLKDRAVIQFGTQRVCDRSLLRIMIVGGIRRLFNAFYSGAQSVDPWIGGDFIFVVSCCESAKDQRNGNHVLHAMIAVGWISQRAFLVDDAETGFVCANCDATNVRSRFAP